MFLGNHSADFHLVVVLGTRDATVDVGWVTVALGTSIPASLEGESGLWLSLLPGFVYVAVLFCF